MHNKKYSREKMRPARSTFASGPVLLGIAGSLALVAGWTMLQARPRSRRYADHANDRRDPLSLFVPGGPRRRDIDRSGAHPLFERRQSVYEAY